MSKEKEKIENGLRKRDHRYYGWRRDLPDRRDFLYSAQRPEQLNATLPPSADLEERMPEVYDQGTTGSCTAQALAAAVQFLQRNDLDDKTEVFIPSRLFIYYNERVIEGNTGSDDGAMLRDGVKTLSKAGAPPEVPFWPFESEKLTTKPTKAAYERGRKHTITSYFRLRTLQEMKACLAANYPFTTGIMVYEDFESERVVETGKVNMPLPNERDMGGHAVLVIGYDDATQRFKVRNSWGEDWGVDGNFTIPYDYLTNRDLSDDFWTLRKTL